MPSLSPPVGSDYRLSGGPKHFPDPSALEGALRGREWVAALTLAYELRTNTRAVRASAAASGGRVISGQYGYRLTREAPVGDVEHAIARLESQAREMQIRAREIRVELSKLDI